MIKDQKLAKSLLENIERIVKQAESLLKSIQKGDYEEGEKISQKLLKMLSRINKKMIELKEEAPEMIVEMICTNAIDSLERIITLSNTRSTQTLMKIEFELIPLIEEMYINFYYNACVYPDPQKMQHYLRYEKAGLYVNKYRKAAKEKGEYKYDLTIMVIGYNKLEYTKQCVESILKYTPQNIKYELILVNHGSTDGTKEYFESISPTKQIDLKINGGGMNAVHRIFEGKYQLAVSNDVIVTENAIANMLACMESDEKIEWIVPTTPNISNLQTIPAQYSDLEEMQEFAKKNNVKDPYRWEQRSRLCNPICMMRNFWEIISENPYFDNFLNVAFPDDRTSLVFRRKGYKMILAKDAYCYHFGSVTVGGETAQYKNEQGNVGAVYYYADGRTKFLQECGIDPWGTGFCWSHEMLYFMPIRGNGPINILGINCGIGSNPLKIKDLFKENLHKEDVKIYNVTDDTRYILDLPGVSDEFKLISTCSDILDVFKDIQFDYIIFEDHVELYPDADELIENLHKKLLKPNGGIVYKSDDAVLNQKVRVRYPGTIQRGSWHTLGY